jgi:hypothetical protein
MEVNVHVFQGLIFGVKAARALNWPNTSVGVMPTPNISDAMFVPGPSSMT